MLLPLFEITFKPTMMLRAASLSVGSLVVGNNRRGPMAWATWTAKSQLVKISISAPITLSASLLDEDPAFSASTGSTPLLSKTYRTNNLASDS